MTTNNAVQYAKLAAVAADEKFGKNILAYDVRNQNAVADIYMFIGATSHIHVKALEDAVRDGLKASDAQLLRTDGQRGHMWRVLDYGVLLIHIMEEKTRDFYSVERLWEQGKKIPVLKPVIELVAKKSTPVSKKAAPLKKKIVPAKTKKKPVAAKRKPVKKITPKKKSKK